MYAASSSLHLATHQYFSTAENNTNLLLIIGDTWWEVIEF